MMQSNSFDHYICHYHNKVLNIFDPKLQLINTKLIIINKLKKLLSEIKKFKGQPILVLEYKNRNDHKFFHSTAKLISSDSDTDETFKAMHQSIMMKIKNSVSEGWVA